MAIKYPEIIEKTIVGLMQEDSYASLSHRHYDGEPFPSEQQLLEIVALCRSVLYPGFFGDSIVNRGTLRYHVGVQLERLYALLSEQVLAGLCFTCDRSKYTSLSNMQEESRAIAAAFLQQLPQLRMLLATDVEAAYTGDPAAESRAEVIFCYPATRAITNYRIAHALYALGVPIIPRMISEMAHSETGIDIHPSATIGSYFTIDHGTGVVVGATSVLGNHVKLYQGVTLGAKSFPLDQEGNPIKGIARHPIIGDGVIIYSNATILGRITVGSRSVIGANLWVTKEVPEDTVVK